MKVNKRLVSLATFLIVAFLFFSGCRKSDRETDTETQTATDNAIAEYVFADVFNQIIINSSRQADLYTPAQPASSDTCAKVIISPAPPVGGFPKVLTMNYGTSNCVGADGVARRGKIMASFTNKLKTANAVITISFDRYYVNDNLLEGNITITNRGKNAGNHIYYACNTNNASVTSPAGKTSWACSRTREWLTGDTTATLADDLFSVTGNGSGVGVKGNSFTTSITKALLLDISCGYIREGTVKITPANLEPRTVDFGVGSCDNQATLMVNGNASTITLK